MLKMLPEYKNAEIVRTRNNLLLDKCDIVVDVGGIFDPDKHRYDHHQKSFNESMSTLIQGKKWITKLSSAGLIYCYFGKRIIHGILEKEGDQPSEILVEKIFDKVYEKFIEEIDGNDNGIATHDGEARYDVTTTLASRVAGLRPPWNDPLKNYDVGFNKAMELVQPEFLERIYYYSNVWWPAREWVSEALENRFKAHESGRIIIFDKGSCPYKEHLYTLETEQNIMGQILFALFPDEANGNWRVQPVPPQKEPFKQRLPLPETWRALRDEELSKISGIKDCIFVHASGFIGGHKNRQGALEMAIKTMELSPDDYSVIVKETQKVSEENQSLTTAN